MRKAIFNATTKQMEVVDLTPDEIADITALRIQEAERAAAPKPGAELLALAEGAKTIAELRGIVVALVRQVYGLPEAAPVIEEPVEETAR